MLLPVATVPEPGARPMKKLALAFVLAFAVIAGAAAVATVSSSPAVACGTCS